MAFIPVPNTVQLEMVFNLQGEVCENVLHYVKASPWNIVDAADLAASAIVEWSAGVKNNVSDQCSLMNIKVTDISSQTGFVVDYGTGLPLAGTKTSPALPNNCTLVFTKRTALRGRSYRGRLYHLGLTEDMVAGNAVGGGNVAGMIVGYNAMRALAITDDEGLMVVVSRKNEGVWRTVGEATLVTNITSDGVIDSQRRRLP